MPSLPTSFTLILHLDEALDALALRQQAAKQLQVTEASLPPIVVRKRSLDCRRGKVRYSLSCEFLLPDLAGAPFASDASDALGGDLPREVTLPARVIVIGDGPAGLFCAYQLARAGVASVVLDRGKPVQPRRRDLKGLTRQGRVDTDSNYCFGEGGAGTYSDGKLYTRSHKRGDVKDVLELLALHGAPEEILIDARPHIGSNRLPRVVSALRHRLEAVGVEFRFGARVVAIATSPGAPRRVLGVRLADGSTLEAPVVVLATGHSARDVYQMLHAAGHRLEPKAFALGIRIEHPQPLINRIQYGQFAGHPALPSAAYRLVESRGGHSVFSFCMCPGGFIVPAMTAPGEVVVNGMSPSERNSKYANSGIVVGIEPEAYAKAGFMGPLGGVALQAAVEQAAHAAAGEGLRAPAARVTDFVRGKGSTTLPASSYVPGLTPTDVGAVLDAAGLSLAETLGAGLRSFAKNLRGYLCEEAVVVGVESRTSSPVRIPRHSETLESMDWSGLYPAGEGAGYAGGIMSAAVDGMRIARAIIQRLGKAS